MCVCARACVYVCSGSGLFQQYRSTSGDISMDANPGSFDAAAGRDEGRDKVGLDEMLQNTLYSEESQDILSLQSLYTFHK